MPRSTSPAAGFAFISFVFVALALAMAALGLGGGCDRAVDGRLESPEATVRTLLSAYGVADVPQEEVVERLRSGGRFDLLDATKNRACFADFRGPEHEGMAGYVFGVLAASKDQLRFETDGDRATVRPAAASGGARGGGPSLEAGAGTAEGPAVTLRRRDGEWRIVLAESVPDEVRERLGLLYHRAREQSARRGIN